MTEASFLWASVFTAVKWGRRWSLWLFLVRCPTLLGHVGSEMQHARRCDQLNLLISAHIPVTQREMKLDLGIAPPPRLERSFCLLVAGGHEAQRAHRDGLPSSSKICQEIPRLPPWQCPRPAVPPSPSPGPSLCLRPQMLQCPERRGFCLFRSLLYPQCSERCLALFCSTCLIHSCDRAARPPFRRLTRLSSRPPVALTEVVQVLAALGTPSLWLHSEVKQTQQLRVPGPQCGFYLITFDFGVSTHSWLLLLTPPSPFKPPGMPDTLSHTG